MKKIWNNVTCDKVMGPAKLFLKPVPRCTCSPSLSSISVPAAWSHTPQGPGCPEIVARQHMLADLVSTGQSRGEGTAWPSEKNQFRDPENWLPL